MNKVRVNSYLLRRWVYYALFILAIAFPAFLGWAAWFVAAQPYDGANWALITGLVEAVDSAGPAAGALRPGDTIVTVGEKLPRQATPLYAGLTPGEPVSFTVRRKGVESRITIYLAKAPLSVVLRRLEPLCIALVFWAVGLIVLTFRLSGEQAALFFLLCQAGSGALVSGALSTIGPLWAASLFNLLLWWVGPLVVHFHLRFPEARSLLNERLLLVILYGLAMVGSVPHLIWGLAALRAWSWYPEFHTASRLNLALDFLLVVVLLWRAYRRAASPLPRQQIRLVALGGCLALMPLGGLGLLPDALLKRPLVPYEVAFLFLLAVPLAYGYAIVRYKLIQLDRHVSRGAAYASVFALLTSLYLVLSVGLDTLLPPGLGKHPLTNSLIMLPMAITFSPLYRQLQRLVDWVFYGGWYNYRTVVEQISRGLDQVTDVTALAQTVTSRLQTVMGLQCACLLLSTSNQVREFPMHGIGCEACAILGRAQASLPMLHEAGAISQYLQRHLEPMDVSRLRRALADASLSGAERQHLNCEQARLWVPLVEQDQLLGALVLGSKRGSEVFDVNDQSILGVIARQTGIVIENLRLTSELRRQLARVNRLHQEILRAREEERKLLARELHDQIIQALVGLNYRLARFSDGQSASLRAGVCRIISDLRRMCSELRPPTLDNLGLVPAVRSYLRELESKEFFRVELSIEGDEERWLPEEVTLCLFRALQEALVNVQKHAAAERVAANLAIRPDEVNLWVQDDGQGFAVPSPLSQLLDDNHFGLVGLRERLDLVHGTLEVTSAPGRGTRLWVRIPLP